MASVVAGLFAGFVASIVMALLMMASSRGQPGINAMLVARALGKPPADSAARMGGMFAHFVYGSVMGAVFVLGSSVLLIGGNLWINGLLFGIALFLIAVLIVMPAAGVNRKMMRSMPKGPLVGAFVFHLIYGVVVVSVIVYGPQLGLPV